MNSPLKPQRPPGLVTVGDWAHIRWRHFQHMIVKSTPPFATTACGGTIRSWMVWHDPALPHLPLCPKCETALEKTT